MSTKKQHRTKNEILADMRDERELEQKSVIAELQAVVEELKARGMTDIDVHSLVNMIWQGWLQNGQPTEEYLRMASKALEERDQVNQGIDIVPSNRIIIGS